MDDNFKDELRDKFIVLMESKRGIPAKLAKSIGKDNNYFSEIKRGNPVNANHLKAVGLVFGPDKVCELLGITDNGANNVFENKDETIVKFQPVVEKHIDIIKQFEDHESAVEINSDLIIIERESKPLFEKTKTYISAMKDAAITLSSKKGRQEKTAFTDQSPESSEGGVGEVRMAQIINFAKKAERDLDLIMKSVFDMDS